MKEDPLELGPLLTRSELAERLRVSEKSIQRWVKEGMPAEQWGPRLRRYNLNDVVAWHRERAATYKRATQPLERPRSDEP